MDNALVKIDPQQFGLQATEAAQVESVFIPMIEKMVELENEFNEIKALPIEPTTCNRAKTLRLKFVKIRTGTAEIHKKAKEYYRKGGLYVDAWKNAQAFASQGKEQELEKIEKHFEILEAQRKEALKAKRIAMIEKYCDDPTMYLVADMSDNAFSQLLNGLKLAAEQKAEAERRAAEEEALRITIERLKTARLSLVRPYYQFFDESIQLGELDETDFEKLLSVLRKAKSDYDKEQDRIKKENERLRKEREAAEAERIRKEKEIAEERKKAAEERRRIEEQARKEREAIEEKSRKEREAAEEKTRIERVEHQKKIDAERAEAEKKRKAAEKKAAEEREQARLEKERLEKIIADTIKCPKCGNEFRISEAKEK